MSFKPRVRSMTKNTQNNVFIGPIKPQMSMTYRDYLRMINDGVGLPRAPTTGIRIIKREDEYICPPQNYRMN